MSLPTAQPSEATDLKLEELLSDLSGLERLQALQMRLVQQLRRQVEAACAAQSAVTPRGRGRRKR
jgi:hypothetical protein